MDQETVSYLVMSALMPIIAFAELPRLGGGIFSIISMLLILSCVAMLLILNWVDYTVFTFVTSVLGITFQPANNYRIPKGQDAVIKSVRGLYYATGFLTANLFPYYFKQEATGAETEESKLLQAPERWERAIMSLDFPFKYHVLSSGLDVQAVRDELEGKRSFQEFQLSRAMQSSASADETTLTDIRRKISVLQARIDRISQGEKPIATIMYMETTAVGVSEKAATDALAAQINSLQISMSGLDVDLVRVVGRELHTLFNFNFALPTTFKEAAGQFDQES